MAVLVRHALVILLFTLGITLSTILFFSVHAPHDDEGLHGLGKAKLPSYHESLRTAAVLHRVRTLRPPARSHQSHSPPPLSSFKPTVHSDGVLQRADELLHSRQSTLPSGRTPKPTWKPLRPDQLLSSSSPPPPPPPVSSPPPAASASAIGRVMVMAMHHSGTSLLARVLMEMGLYGGRRGEFKLQKARKGVPDPAKFWERNDVIELNEMLVKDALVFDKDPGWITGFAYENRRLSRGAAEHFEREFARIVRSMQRDAGTGAAIVIKEPRLCITGPQWRAALLNESDGGAASACVLIYRHPYHVAVGLRGRPRNRGLLLEHWLALWEKYQRGALHACCGLPKVLVAHDDFARDAAGTVERLYEQLVALGVRGLRPVPRKWLRAFLPAHEPAPLLPEHDRSLSSEQLALWRALQSGEAALDSVECARDQRAEWRRDVVTAAEAKFIGGEHMSMHEETVSKRDGDGDSGSDALVRAIHRVKSTGNNDVIIVPTNTFFSNLARNLVCSYRRTTPTDRLPLIVLGLDDHACVGMHGFAPQYFASDRNCFYERSFGVGVANLQRWSMNKDSQYHKILRLKMSYALWALRAGVNVLLADADIVFAREPLAAIRQEPHFADVDMLVQSDARGANVAPEKRNWLCAGFFYAKHNARTIRFMEQVLEIMAEFGAPDQDVFQLLLLGSGQNFAFPPDWQSRNADWLTAEQMELRWALLDERRYANGGRFFGRKKSERVEHEVIVHANMRGYPKKVESLQRAKLWYLDPMNEDICIRDE